VASITVAKIRLKNHASSQGHQRIRAVLGDVDALEEAVDWLETYERFHPDRFDRRKVNRRLKQYAQGDEEWRWE
jgi:hypothetical protein